MIRIIVYTLLLLGITNIYAEDITESEDALHIAAHFGSTYGITHAGEVICKKITGQSKLACTLESAVLANVINIGRKAAQGMPSDSKRAIIAGAAGSVAAGLFIQIDW